jgi:hypothetical protein
VGRPPFKPTKAMSMTLDHLPRINFVRILQMPDLQKKLLGTLLGVKQIRARRWAISTAATSAVNLETFCGLTSTEFRNI